MCWVGGAFQRLAGERFVLQKEGSHYTLRPSVFVFSNHPSFHTYFDMFLWPNLPPFFECGTVQGPPSGHFSPLSLPRTFRTTGAVRGIIPPRDCPSPALPPRALATLSTKKKVSFGERTRNCVTCFTEGKKHSPTHPPTQPATHTHTHNTHTPTHPHQHTRKQAHRHTATEPPPLFEGPFFEIPDARCQMPDQQVNRLTNTQAHTDTQTHRHADTHTAWSRSRQTNRQTHTDKGTDTQPQSHPNRSQTADGRPRTHILMLTGQLESTSHRWASQIKSTQPEGTNVKHRKQIGCMHSSQKQSCTRKALTLTVTVDRR